MVRTARFVSVSLCAWVPMVTLVMPALLGSRPISSAWRAGEHAEAP